MQTAMSVHVGLGPVFKEELQQYPLMHMGNSIDLEVTLRCH